MAENLAMAVGRRKASVARIYMRKGNGHITVNGREVKDYFRRLDHQRIVKLPFEVSGKAEDFDVLINVYGGGITGQAEAILLGISRGLEKVDGSLRPGLRENGFLTRDSRIVERKKYGKKGARRSFQFSKR